MAKLGQRLIGNEPPNEATRSKIFVSDNEVATEADPKPAAIQ